MADPNFPVNIPANTWTKVASNVTSGFLFKKRAGIRYLQTYRVISLGNPDPTLVDEGVAMFQGSSITEQISSSEPIDVWVYCDGADGVLRVDV
jgi:hypothetical protein